MSFERKKAESNYPLRDWDGVYVPLPDSVKQMTDTGGISRVVRALSQGLEVADDEEASFWLPMSQKPKRVGDEQAERWRVGDGGSSSPMVSTSVVAGAPPDDMNAWGVLYRHLRRIRRARRRRMEEAWGIVSSLGRAQPWANGPFSGDDETDLSEPEELPNAAEFRRLRECLEESYRMTVGLMDLHVYHPSNRLVLEMITLREVYLRLPMRLQPPVAMDISRFIDLTCVTCILWDRPGNELPEPARLLPRILNGESGILLADGSGDTPSPWHRLLELAAVLLNEWYPFGPSMPPPFTDELAKKRMKEFWTALVLACRLLHPEEWAYAGEAVSAIPDLIGLDLRD